MRSDGATESSDFPSLIMFRGGTVVLRQLLSGNIYDEKEKVSSFNLVIYTLISKLPLGVLYIMHTSHVQIS